VRYMRKMTGVFFGR